MRLWALSTIAAVALSTAAPTLAANAGGNVPQPGTRGPVIQTVAPAPAPPSVPSVVSA